jgi:hypothetical protein
LEGDGPQATLSGVRKQKLTARVKTNSPILAENPLNDPQSIIFVTVDEMLKISDHLMYAAKKNGKNTVRSELFGMWSLTGKARGAVVNAPVGRHAGQTLAHWSTAKGRGLLLPG